MRPLAEIQHLLAIARADLFHRYPLRRLGIFGSLARGEAHANSDIDLLVEFTEPVGFEIVDLALELEALLDHPVDLVSWKALSPRMRPYVEKDLIDV
jgi:hypothetical protein